jgi:arylsulfatase
MKNMKCTEAASLWRCDRGSRVLGSPTARAQEKKPNILVIFGDDIGYWNISAYNQGIWATDADIDAPTKGRSSPTTTPSKAAPPDARLSSPGSRRFAPALTKVGLPGSDLGIKKEDPTLAELLKAQGYLTFQHGKNHLGDRKEFFPTVHGFDEFFGNFYHLNAEEEPENVDYPTDPNFDANLAPRGLQVQSHDHG